MKLLISCQFLLACFLWTDSMMDLALESLYNATKWTVFHFELILPKIDELKSWKITTQSHRQRTCPSTSARRCWTVVEVFLLLGKHWGFHWILVSLRENCTARNQEKKMKGKKKGKKQHIFSKINKSFSRFFTGNEYWKAF